MLTASLMRWRGMGETKAEAAGAHDDEADIPMIVTGKWLLWRYLWLASSGP